MPPVLRHNRDPPSVQHYCTTDSHNKRTKPRGAGQTVDGWRSHRFVQRRQRSTAGIVTAMVSTGAVAHTTEPAAAPSVEVAAPGDTPRDVPVCWTRGGLTVTSLRDEFNAPDWEPRGQFRALKQFVMNWNNWPSQSDRAAMLDGPPPDDMPIEQRARIAAVVHCLCERDGHPIPDWVADKRAPRRGGVLLIADRHYRNRYGYADGFTRLVKRATPRTARGHRVFFEAALLDSR